MKKRKNCC